MPEPAARAYLRDLPDAELHLFEEGGHWLLETHLAEVVPLVRGFLAQVLSRSSDGKSHPKTRDDEAVDRKGHPPSSKADCNLGRSREGTGLASENRHDAPHSG